MKNLAGDQKADETILEELYLANIPAVKVSGSNGEVPYTFVGKIGKWTLKRAWYYWIASVEDKEAGLPLKEALELHNKKHPTKDDILGNIIRSGGDCGCPSPDEYGAQPIYNDELDRQLEAIGYKKQYSEYFKKWYIPITFGDVSKLCNEGKLNVERYVSCYHIDEQIGLNEFARAIVDFENKCNDSAKNSKEGNFKVDDKVKRNYANSWDYWISEIRGEEVLIRTTEDALSPYYDDFWVNISDIILC